MDFHKRAFPVIAVILIAALLCIHANMVNQVIAHGMPSDLMSFYHSGKALATIGNPYLIPILNTKTNTASLLASPTLSMPLASFIFAAISKFANYQQTFILWDLLSVFFLITALFINEKYLLKNQMHPRLIYRTLCILAFPPTFISLYYGEPTPLIFLLLTLAILSLHRKQLLPACICLAIAANIKPFFLFFCIYFFTKKHYKALTLFLLLFLIMFYIPIAANFSNIIKSYLIVLEKITWYGNNWNASLNGIITRLFGQYGIHNNSLFDFPAISIPSYWLLSIIYVGACFFSLKKCNNQSLAIAATLSTMLLVSPLANSYYFLLLYLPYHQLRKFLNQSKRSKTLQHLLYACLLLSFLNTTYTMPLVASKFFLIVSGNISFVALFIFTNISLYVALTEKKQCSSQLTSQKTKTIVILLCTVFSVISYCSANKHLRFTPEKRIYQNTVASFSEATLSKIFQKKQENSIESQPNKS